MEEPNLFLVLLLVLPFGIITFSVEFLVEFLISLINRRFLSFNSKRCKPCRLWDCPKYKECPLSSFNIEKESRG